jgi:hypothetical protein
MVDDVVVSSEEYVVLLEEYLALKKSIKELQTQQDFVKSQLSVLLERDGLESFESEAAEVFVTKRNFSSVDKQKGLELFGERFNEIVSVKESCFLTVKERS